MILTKETILLNWLDVINNNTLAVDTKMSVFSDIDSLKESTILSEGQLIYVYGYYTPFDGGNAYYKIREKLSSDSEDGGYIHFLNNNLVAELFVHNGTISLKQFGAHGDGVTDDYTFIQKAFTYSKNKNLVIDINGHFITSYGIQYYSNTQIISSSVGVIELMEGITSENIQSKQILFTNTGVENVTIRGVTFNQRGDVYSNNGTSPCISIRMSNNVYIENCTFKNVQTMAVFSDVNTTSNIFIKNNTIENSYGGGISVFGTFEECIISNNIISDTKDDAIAIQRNSSDMLSKNILIEGNIIKDCNTEKSDTNGVTKARGILSYAGENVVITNNIIENTSHASIFLYDDYITEESKRYINCTISNNICKNAGDNNEDTYDQSSGIWIMSGDVTVSNNIVYNNVIVSNNIIENPKSSGIRLNNVSNCSVIGNNIVKSGFSGIYMMNCSNSVFKGNIIENAGYMETSDVSAVGIYMPDNNVYNIIESNRVYSDYTESEDGTRVYTTKRGIFIKPASTNNKIVNNIFYDTEMYNYNTEVTNEFSKNITHSGYPTCVDVTLTQGNLYHWCKNISLDLKQNVIVVPKNIEANTLLTTGNYYISEAGDESVYVKTSIPAQGTEKITFVAF